MTTINTRTKRGAVLGACVCAVALSFGVAHGAVSVTASRDYVDRKVAALNEAKADKSVVVTNGSDVVTNTVLYSDADLTPTMENSIDTKFTNLVADISTSYKTKQSPVSSPSASSNSIQFIDTISQNDNGVITATKKNVRTATTSQTGIVQLNDGTNSTSTAQAATANAVKKVSDNINSVSEAENLHDARNLRDLSRLYTSWFEPLPAYERAGGYATITFTPSAFGARSNCVIREVTIMSSSTASTLPTVPVYAKFIDPDNTAVAMSVSRPIDISAVNTLYTFIFDTDATFVYNKQYRLVFYSGKQDGAGQVAVGIRLSAKQSEDQLIYYAGLTRYRPIMGFLYSDTSASDYVRASDIENIITIVVTNLTGNIYWNTEDGGKTMDAYYRDGDSVSNIVSQVNAYLRLSEGTLSVYSDSDNVMPVEIPEGE